MNESNSSQAAALAPAATSGVAAQQLGIWKRVTRASRCPVCQHDSWCSIGVRAVHCMRVDNGKPASNGEGWLHPLADGAAGYHAPFARSLPTPVPVRDFAALAERWQRDLTPARLQTFADSLGVAPDALRSLGCGWSGSAFSFPMYNAQRKIVGIRLRTFRGRKFAVTTSRQGAFLHGGEPHGTLLIVEGPSDAAAGLTLGFDVHGRPSCTGAVSITAALTRGRDVAIIVDADEPGRRGAEVLASKLLPVVCSLRVVEAPSPHKDLRAWLQAGATAEQVRSLIESQPARVLHTRFRYV
jgi:hypothetical protein